MSSLAVCSSLTAVLVGIRMLACFLQHTKSYSSGLKLCFYAFMLWFTLAWGFLYFIKQVILWKQSKRHFVESRRQKSSLETAEFAKWSTSFLSLQRVPHRHNRGYHGPRALSACAKPTQACQCSGFQRQVSKGDPRWQFFGEILAESLTGKWEARCLEGQPLQVRAGQTAVSIAGERNWWIHSYQAGFYHLNYNLPFKFWQAFVTVCWTNLSFVFFCLWSSKRWWSATCSRIPLLCYI